MAKYFVNDTSLKAIADAIRAKTGRSNSMTLGDMPTEISSITTGGTPTLLKPSDYPDYVRTEINRVADEVRKVLTKKSIVSICMSDSHYPGNTQTKTSALHAIMAIKGLTYLLPVDFIAHLGDVGYEGVTNTEPNTDLLESNLLEMLSYIKESGGESIPLFVAIGNHDSGTYVTADDYYDLVDGRYLYNNLTALSASGSTVFSGEEYGGYCYRDFEEKKLRVFLLNTSEEMLIGGSKNDKGTSVTQRAWVASKLQELNTKSDASEWGFIVLCHYPADYGSSKTLSNVFEAYVNGTSITLNGTTYNFSGKNAARFLVQFHGHIHNFLVDKLYGGAVSSSVNGTPSAQYHAYRMAIPNAQYNRENHYYNKDPNSTDGTLWGIKFFEGSFDDLGASAQYSKTPNSATDTSFVVNVINPDEDKIYSFHYGAGYDRVLGIGTIKYYSITRSFTNVSTNNTDASVEEGSSYTEIITLDSGYEMKEISITMNGIDISSSAIAVVDGQYHINIPVVDGNIIVLAKAQLTPNFTNLVPTAVDADGTDYNVDGDGYDNGVYITSSNTLEDRVNWVTTGYIPIKTGSKTIRIAGDGITADGTYTRVAFYDDSFNLTTKNPTPYQNMGSSKYFGTLVEEDATVITWVIDSKWMADIANSTHMRVCTGGDGKNLIVTVDEEITYG